MPSHGHHHSRDPLMTRRLTRSRPAQSPESSLTAELAKKQTVEEQVMGALTKDPAFRIMTIDGLNWLCPYTGRRIPAPFGHIEPAKAYLLHERPWTKSRLRSPADLYIFRWKLFLKEHADNDARLRIFGQDGRWLNPFTGEWVRLQKPAGSYTPDATHEIALTLAKCRAAQHQPMLDRVRLEDVVRETRAARQALANAPDATIPSGRVIGEDSGPVPIDDDRARAKNLIAKILSPLPQISGYALQVHYEPCKGLGGDFYDCTALGDEQFFIAVGDVNSLSIEGAMLAVSTIKSLHHILQNETDLVAVMTRLNRAVKGDLPHGQFITMFAGILDVRARTFTCVCAGNHPGLIASAQRRAPIERLGHEGPALGLHDDATFGAALVPEIYHLLPGDILFLYTDGLCDAMSARGVQYGDLRVMGRLLDRLDQPFTELVPSAITGVKEFAGNRLDDDLTVFAIACETAPVDLPDWMDLETSSVPVASAPPFASAPPVAKPVAAPVKAPIPEKTEIKRRMPDIPAI